MASAESTAGLGQRRGVKRKSRALPAIVAFAVLGGLGWWGWTKTHPAEDSTAKLITAPVTRNDLTETISATGSVTAQTGAQVKIGSQITGRIKRLFADVGSQVRAGQLIAELDLPDIEAQLGQAEANLALARTKLRQQESGQGMQQTQTADAIRQAQADLRSAQARYEAVRAAASQQTAQTPTEIRRAETSVSASRAALSTAQSNLKQVQASANLQVSNAQDQLTQAQANNKNAQTNLARQKRLLDKGFVAQAVVDDAQAQATVTESQVKSAQQSIQLVKEKVAADIQAARDQVTQAQQNVEAANASLESARAGTYSDKAKQADVQDALAQIQRARTALNTARSNTVQNTLKVQDIQQARDAVKAAQAQVNYWRAQLDKTQIRSPISGTVLQMAAQQGETLAAGLSAPTLIVVADLNRLQVDAFVDETDIGKVKLGQAADITVDAYPHRTFKGTVSKIASGSTIQQGVVTYDVTIALEDTHRQLKPDMTASVTLRTGVRKDVILVPAEAVKMGVKGSTVNVVVNQDGKNEVEPRKVKTGASDGVNTEIREGLKEGEIIVLAGMEDGRRRQGPSSPFGPNNNQRGGGGGGGGRRGG
jgi:HlyD family secretion protein